MPVDRMQEAVFGLPKIAPRISAELLESRLVPAFRALAADRVWLVRAAAAAALPAVAGTLPAGKLLASLAFQLSSRIHTKAGLLLKILYQATQVIAGEFGESGEAGESGDT